MIRLYRMDCLNAIKLFALLTLVHATCGQTVTVSGPSTAPAATNVSLTCTVNGGTANGIQWVEDVPGGGSTTLFNGDVPFSINPKYSNFDVTSLSTTESVMTIEDADVLDDGEYRCLIPSDEFATPINLVVETNSTKTSTLTSIVTDNEDMYVATCDAVGGKPQETITWTINGVEQTNGDGNTIVDTNPPATAPLSNSKSVFTFPATLQNYGQTLVCDVSGHDVLTELNGQEPVDLNIHSAPSADDIMTVELQFLNTSQEVRVSCNISDEDQPTPRIRNYYIYSDGILNLIQKSSTGVNFVDVQQSEFSPGFEFNCVAGNYLGNITTYDPPSTTTLTPTTTAALEKTTKSGDETGSGPGTVPKVANIGAIVGGVVGAIVIIVIIVIAVCYCKKEERFCFEAGGAKSSGSSKPAGSAVGSSNGSEREKTKPEAAPRGHGSIQHTNDNPNQDMYAMVDKKPSTGRGGDAPDRGSGPGQNEPQGMLYADLDLSHKAGHTDKHVPKNENDVVVYSSILV